LLWVRVGVSWPLCGFSKSIFCPDAERGISPQF
jgi:hypothetical protein